MFLDTLSLLDLPDLFVSFPLVSEDERDLDLALVLDLELTSVLGKELSEFLEELLLLESEVERIGV